MIYIFKNNLQTGPYEEKIVLEQLRSGVLSPNDLAIKHGQEKWQPLSVLFPNVVPTPPPAPPAVPVATVATATPAVVVPVVETAPLYRKTLLAKVFFGLVFLACLAAVFGTGYYFWSMMGSSGDLQADLRNMSFRILVRNAAIGLAVATFFTFIAFLLSFKRKIIVSNGLRIVVRVFFIFVLLAGIADLGYGVFSYLNYTKPYVSSARKDDKNELLDALEEGEAATGPYEGPVIHIPIAGGLIMLALSGILMTKRGRPELT